MPGARRAALAALAGATAFALLGALAGTASMPAAASTSASTSASNGWSSVRLTVQNARIAGTTIAWAELGSGPPLVLLNGTASPMSEWDPAFLAGLAARHRVIVLDYPGLGGSGPAPGPWTFDAASDWVADLVTAVVPEGRADVLGWSMGGFIAQRLAVRHPSTVRALVLAATNPGGSHAVLGPRWVQEIDSSSSSDADYLRTNYPAAGRAAGRAFLARLAAAVDSGAYPEADTPDATLDAMVAAEDPWLASDRNLRDLGSLDLPALVVTGRQDLITPAINSTRIAALIPGARLVLVPASGHSFLFQRPAAVAALVDGFLASAGVSERMRR